MMGAALMEVNLVWLLVLMTIMVALAGLSRRWGPRGQVSALLTCVFLLVATAVAMPGMSGPVRLSLLLTAAFLGGLAVWRYRSTTVHR